MNPMKHTAHSAYSTKKPARRPNRPEASFWAQAKTLSPAEGQKALSLEKIRADISRKKLRPSPRLWDLALIELQYITPAFWILQIVVIAAFIILAEKLSLTQSMLKDYVQPASVTAALLSATASCSLGRHFSRGMAELEQSCYFNLPQLWTIKMILAGSLDIFALTLCSCRIAQNTLSSFFQVCLYILVPFVFSNVCCLFFLTLLRGEKGRFGQLVIAFPAGAAAFATTLFPPFFYTAAFLWVWLVLLFMGFTLYLWQIRLIYNKMKRGDALCWS